MWVSLLSIACPCANRALRSCSPSSPPRRGSPVSSRSSRRPGRAASRSSRSCSARRPRTSPTACWWPRRSASCCSAAGSRGAAIARGRQRSGCSRSRASATCSRSATSSTPSRARCRSPCCGGSAPTSTRPAIRTARRARWRRRCGRCGALRLRHRRDVHARRGARAARTSCSATRSCNVTLGLVGIDPTSHPGRFEHGLTISLASAAIICAAYVVWLALRPRDCAVSQHAADRRDARRLVERHGRDSLAYFALRRDKSYFFNERAHGVPRLPRCRAAWRSSRATRSAIRRPRRALLRRLRASLPRARLAGRRARRRAPAPRADWHAIGLRTIYVGDEAVVHPRALLARGPADPQGAAVGHRAAEGGPHARIVRARELTLEQRREVERVSRTWLRGQPERGFSMALDDMHAPDHGDAVFALGYDAGRGASSASSTSCRRPRSRRLSLSAMRRLHQHAQRADGVPALRDVRVGGGRGIERISLNFNAFGDLLRSDAKLPAWERAPARRCWRAPTASSRSSACSSSTASSSPSGSRATRRSSATRDLPLAALVLLSIESLVAWPGVLRRLWPHASPAPSAPAAGRPV